MWDIPPMQRREVQYVGCTSEERQRPASQSRKDESMNATVIKEYDARIDMKKRITLRGAEAEYFAVRMFDDGHILLEPRVLVPPEAVSKKALRMLDKAARNFKKGNVSEPIDLDRYL